MKKASKIMAVVLCVCLLFSLASVVTFAGPVPNANYEMPKRNIAKMTTRPKIDGNLNDWKSATKEPFTKEALKAGSGQLWSYSEDELFFDELPDDGDGTAYFAWDEEYFYFALEVEDDENTNNESLGVNLWKGDCLQLQIGKDKESSRYELGFALSQFGGTRRLGYQWFPIEDDLKQGGKQDMNNSNATANYYYYVERKGNKTIYEIALKYSAFGRETKLAAGDMIPFSFSLQLYSDEPDPMNLGETKRYFMEWAKGVVGGTVEKVLTTAGELTLVDGDNPPPATTTTKAPTTTVAIGTTTKAPSTGETTKAPVTGETTKAPVAGETTTVGNTEETTTTEATTTTEIPVQDGTVFYVEENATDVDDAATVDAIKADFPDKDIAIKKFVATEKKFGIGQNFLEGVYVKDADGKFVALEGAVEEIENADGSVDEWMMYEVEKDAELYIVKMVPPTTTAAPTTTTTEPAATDAPTTKAPEAGNEANNDETKEETNEGGFPIWIVIVAVVVVAAAVAAFIILKKKKGAVEE